MKCSRERCPNDAVVAPTLEFRPPSLYRYSGKPLEMMMPALGHCREHANAEIARELLTHFNDTLLRKMRTSPAVSIERSTVRWIEIGGDEHRKQQALIARGEH